MVTYLMKKLIKQDSWQLSPPLRRGGSSEDRTHEISGI